MKPLQTNFYNTSRLLKFSQDDAEDGFRSLINNQKIIVVKTKDKLI